MLLMGEISSGDAEKIEGVWTQISEDVYNRRVAASGYSGEDVPMSVVRYANSGPKLCLDSPGGNLRAAYEVIKYIEETPLSTAVSRDATCESACALVFLAGRYLGFGQGKYIEGFDRILHPQGRLGFHAPKLELSDQDFRAEEVEAAYALGMSTIARIVETGIIPIPLLVRMLETPPNEMSYVETVGQALLFDIEIGPVGLAPVSAQSLVENACRNAALYRHASRDSGFELWEFGEEKIGKVEIGLDGGFPWECRMASSGDHIRFAGEEFFNSSKFIRDSFRDMPDFSEFMTYPADSRIDQLPEYDESRNLSALSELSRYLEGD